MSTARVHIDAVDGLARGDEKPISFRPAKAQISSRFRQFDLADDRAFRIEDMNAVVAVSGPACG